MRCKFFNIKRIVSWQICFSIIFQPYLLFSSKAYAEMNLNAIRPQSYVEPRGPEFSYSDFDHLNVGGVKTVKDELNYYRSLGLDPFDSTTTQEAIRSAAQRPPTVFETGRVDLEGRLGNETQRRIIIAELEQVKDLLQQAGANDIDDQYKSAKRSERSRLERIKKPNWSSNYITQHTQINSLKEVIEKNLNQHAGKALGIFDQAGKVLGNEKSRIAYDVNNGFRSFKQTGDLRNFVDVKGKEITVRTKDEKGRWVNVRIANPSKDDIQNIKPSSIIESLKDPAKMAAKGGLTLGVGTLMFITLLHGMSYIKLFSTYAGMTDSAAIDPGLVEKSFNTYFNSLFLTSFITMFAGGYVSKGFYQIYKRSLYGLAGSELAKRVYSSSPKWLEAFRAKSMFGLGVGSMAMGGAIQFAYIYGSQKLNSCIELLGNEERPTDEQPKSSQEKEELKQLCDMDWATYAKNLKLPAIKHVLSIAIGWSLMMRLAGRAADKAKMAIGANRANELRVLAHGFHISQVWAMARMMGIMGAVTVLTHLLWDWFDTRWKVFRPVGKSKEELLAGLDKVKDNNWQISVEGCKSENQEEVMNCERNQIDAKLKEFSQAHDSYRGYILTDFNESVKNWMDYFGKAMNTYRAGRVFYGDIAEQVAIRRGMKNPFEILAPEKSRKFVEANLTKFASERLPLFKSSPFFGVKASDSYSFFQYPSFIKWDKYINFPIDMHANENEKRSQFIREEVAPKIEKDLIELKEKHKTLSTRLISDAEDIISRLKSNSMQVQSEGVLMLSYKNIDDNGLLCDPNNYKNRKHSEPHLLKNSECFFYNAYYVYLTDENIFNGLKYPFKPGYKIHAQDKTMGARPLYPGYEFMENYDRKRLAPFKIDSGWYEGEFDDRIMHSMSEYLLYSAFCGADEDKILSRWGWGFTWKFNPPKLPLKSNQDFCATLNKMKRSNQSEKAYFMIENEKDSSTPYLGFVDLLYKELGNEVTGKKNFEKWWDDTVKLRLENLIVEHDTKFEDGVLEGVFPKVMHNDDTDNTWALFGEELPEGFVNAFFLELDTYMDELFKPLYDSLDLDFSTFENQKMPEGFDREQYFSEIKGNLYQSLNKVTSTTRVKDFKNFVEGDVKDMQMGLMKFLTLFRAREYTRATYLSLMSVNDVVNILQMEGNEEITEESLKTKLEEKMASRIDFACGNDLKDEVMVKFSDLKPVLDENGQKIINECGKEEMWSSQQQIILNLSFAVHAKLSQIANLFVAANALKKLRQEL